MAKIEKSEAQAEELVALTLAVKSRILEGIAKTIADPSRFEDCTSTYTKSDGTNYGMYQKTCSVSAYEEIWETISGMQRVVSGPSVQAKVSQGKE
jgi:hypothetical protein